MRYFAILCAATAVAACSKSNKNASMNESAGGAVAPAAARTDTMGTSGAAAGSTATSGTAASSTATSRDTSRMHHGRSGTDTSGASHRTARNQTQSGMMNKSGKSTLGPKAKKTTPRRGRR